MSPPSFPERARTRFSRVFCYVCGMAALLDELFAIYRDADALVAGWSCPASTECCRFGITGREPYVTSLELSALERALAGRGGLPRRASARRGALPLAGRAERRCPVLTAEGSCAAYDARPLGCRTFYCDRATAGSKIRQRDVNALVRRIQDLAARHAPGGDEGRPLTRALTSARRP